MADTDTVTVKTDLVVPEVISSLVMRDELFSNTPLLNSSYVVDMGAGIPYKDGGDTVKFLTREFATGVTRAKSYVKDMVRDSKTGATGTKVKISSYTEDVTDKIIPIEYEGWAINDSAAAGDIESWFAEILAEAVAEELHDALITEAANTTLTFDGTTLDSKTMNVDTIIHALSQWGEKQARPGAGLFMHSQQYLSIAASEKFQNIASSATTDIAKMNQARDELSPVARVMNVDLYLLDTVSSTTVGAEEGKTLYTGLLMLPGALGLLIKDTLMYAPARTTGTSLWQVDYDFRYVTTLIRNNPRRVVKVTTQDNTVS